MGSDYLFAWPSMLSGFSRLLDMGATFDSYNISRSEREADARALYSDWAAIGHDLEVVYERLKPEWDASLAEQQLLFDPEELKRTRA